MQKQLTAKPPGDATVRFQSPHLAFRELLGDSGDGDSRCENRMTKSDPSPKSSSDILSCSRSGGGTPASITGHSTQDHRQLPDPKHPGRRDPRRPPCCDLAGKGRGLLLFVWTQHDAPHFKNCGSRWFTISEKKHKEPHGKEKVCVREGT